MIWTLSKNFISCVQCTQYLPTVKLSVLLIANMTNITLARSYVAVYSRCGVAYCPPVAVYSVREAVFSVLYVIWMLFRYLFRQVSIKKCIC